MKLNLPPRKFGSNLRKTRQYLHMTASELANRAGITAAAISQIENGTREPSYSTIIAILKALPVKFERLAGDDL